MLLRFRRPTMPSNIHELPYSGIEGKSIIFYDVRYDRAFIWYVHSETTTTEIIRAWTALGVPAVGLYTGCIDGHLEVVPFEGYTDSDLKRYLTICDGAIIPPGAIIVRTDEELYVRTDITSEDWGV